MPEVHARKRLDLQVDERGALGFGEGTNLGLAERNIGEHL